MPFVSILSILPVEEEISSIAWVWLFHSINGLGCGTCFSGCSLKCRYTENSDYIPFPQTTTAFLLSCCHSFCRPGCDCRICFHGRVVHSPLIRSSVNSSMNPITVKQKKTTTTTTTHTHTKKNNNFFFFFFSSSCQQWLHVRCVVQQAGLWFVQLREAL